MIFGGSQEGRLITVILNLVHQDWKRHWNSSEINIHSKKHHFPLCQNACQGRIHMLNNSMFGELILIWWVDNQALNLKIKFSLIVFFPGI